MNRDLKEFINTFEALDDQALYEIGVYHKTVVPFSERSWSELYGYLDVEKFGSSENYRKWVVKQQSDGREVTAETPLLTGSETISREKCDLYKDKIIINEYLNGVRKSLRDEAHVEEFRNNLINAINEIPKLDKIKFSGKISGKKQTEAVLLLSDLHIGAVCDNFYNKYDLDVAKKRLAKVVDTTVEMCKSNGVKKLNVINLGDMIQGIIHTNARVTQQLDVCSQVSIAAELVAQALNELQKAAPEVIVRGCSDNHSRCTPDKEDAIDSENFGRLLDEIVRLRLADCKGIKFVDDNLDYGLGKFKLINGKTCCFAHGHQDNINQVFQNYVGATQEFIDYIFLGHFHNSKMKSFNGSKVFVNGSIMGTDAYALGKRLFGYPEQTLLLFSNNNLINVTIDLREEN